MRKSVKVLNSNKSKAGLSEPVKIVLIVFFAVLLLLALISALIFSYISPHIIPSGDIQESENYNEFKTYIEPFGFGADDFKTVYKSPNDEYLILLNDGIISNRHAIISDGYIVYVPFVNIDSVIKQLPCKGGLIKSDDYMLILKSKIEREGTKIAKIPENILLPINQTTELRKTVEYEEGLVLLEFVDPKEFEEFKNIFLSKGFTMIEQECAEYQ